MPVDAGAAAATASPGSGALLVTAPVGTSSAGGTPEASGVAALPITREASIASAVGISKIDDVRFWSLRANSKPTSSIVKCSVGARSTLPRAGLLVKRSTPQATTSVAENAINPTATKITGNIEYLRFTSKNSAPIVNKPNPAVRRMRGHIKSMPARARICPLASVKTVAMQIRISTAHFPNRCRFFASQ